MGSCATMGTTTRASVSTSLNDFVAKGMPSATAMSPRRTSNPCDFRASYKKGRSTALTKKAGAFGGRCAFTPRIITGNCLSRTSLTPPTGVLRTFSISHRAWRYRNRARDSSPPSPIASTVPSSSSNNRRAARRSPLVPTLDNVTCSSRISIVISAFRAGEPKLTLTMRFIPAVLPPHSAVRQQRIVPWLREHPRD